MPGLTKLWTPKKNTTCDSNKLFKCFSSAEKKGEKENSNLIDKDCLNKIRDLTKRISLKGHSGKITCLKLLPDNKLITGSFD